MRILRLLIHFSLFMGLLLAFIGLPNNAHAQDEFSITIMGKIVQSDDSTPVRNVHIIRFSDAKGAISNQDGDFILPLKSKTDSFVLAAVGYGRSVYDPPDTFEGDTLAITIYLDPYTYQLPAVEFIEEPTQTMDMDFDLSEKTLREVEASQKIDNSGGITIDGAVTGLYKALTNQGHQQRKLKRLKLKQKNVEFLSQGPYRAYIESEFGLTGKDLLRFLHFCNYKRDLTNKNYYEVVDRLEFWHTRFKSWLISQQEDIDYQHK